MIWPHRIRVSYTRPYVPPQYNEDGNEVYETVDQLVPGQVVPLGGKNVADGWQTFVETRYRIMLAPVLNLPLQSVAVSYEWQGQQLAPQGAPERHMRGGRLHHYEAVSQSLA